MHEPGAEMATRLGTAWSDVVATLTDVSEADAWAPTGCAGWSVRDLTFHLLMDAQRALVALGTPSSAAPDTDAVSYWRDWRPDSDRAQNNLRMTRIAASVYPSFGILRDEYVETTRAAAHLAAGAAPSSAVGTQGHVLRVGDLLATMVVEAGVHHLDLVGGHTGGGPRAATLAVVRDTLDGLLGQPVPLDWDLETYARAGTGRRELSTEERAALGPLADRFPLFG